MWKLVFGSVQGTSHTQSGMPCQDYCSGLVSGTTVMAACADGAGSAELSQLGSKAAVDRFIKVACGDAEPTKEQLEAWVDSARENLLEAASETGSAPRQLACTFLAALVGDGWAAFAQIGDGVIVFDGPAGYELAFWPENGEYANTTRFLSDEDYRQHLRVEIIPRQVSELAVLTDGLQMLALDLAGARVHDRFFAPLFKAVRKGPDETVLQALLLEFMDSKRVNERTDDDKTLLLAARITPNVSPNLSDATA
ncbi:PP2C family serine/threonine-protein phosphatase [Anatilimnocola floriformis]|uniref:PP2C family serine/threonine-protein phosphatase n=1 Tax=Anatilimnocola floriformis TaxID=2948575 RepID=UPI0020C3588A|nr:PP2C family serine/threonine-protein phosphatase [Anatilimnocola floriformis]